MPSQKKTFHALRRQVQEIAKDYKIEDPREAFPVWFSQAMLTDPEDDQSIKRAIIGGKNDRNIDILFVSDAARIVYICQTKYRDKLFATAEKPNDVTALAHVAADFRLSKPDFLEKFSGAKPEVLQLLDTAWHLVRDRRYAIRAAFVTTGRVTPATRAQAEAIVDGIHPKGGQLLNIEYLVYDGKDCCRLQIDLEDLVPAIPFIEFDGLTGHVKIKGSSGDAYSYVFAVPTSEIAKVFDENGERLFARNIRLSKGDKTPVNKEIIKSLDSYPSDFFYLNNGITVLGSSAEPKGDHRFRVSTPQIINGQQTTRMIAAHAGRNASKASVLVKVIARRADSDDDVSELRQFVQRVVRATNFQNKVKLSELAANSPEHIRLERGLKSLGWQYIRKLGKKDSESVSRWSGLGKPYGKVTLQEVTTAVVACLHDPQYIRLSGIETIFEGLFEESHENLYRRLFPAAGHDAEQYLFCVLCYRLAGEALTKPNTAARSIENHGRYYVAHRIHGMTSSLFRDTSSRRVLLERFGATNFKATYSDDLWDLRAAVGRSWTAFYRNRGAGDIRSFVGEIASRQTWKSFFDNAHKNAKWRRLALEAVDKLSASM